MATATLTSRTAGAARISTVALTLVLLGLQLRPTVTSIGALLDHIQTTTGMTAAVASVLVAAPMWCLSGGSWIAWHARLRYGTHRAVTIALVVLTAALGTRPLAGQALLLAGTVTACTAIAVLTMLLPPIVQARPAAQRTLMFGCYSVALGTGSALGAVSPMLATATGWQVAAAAWALPAAAALAAWQLLGPNTDTPTGSPPARPRLNLLRLAPASTAWALTVHLGTTVAYSFTIIGWLPACLAAAHVPHDQIPWMYGLAMGIGIPLAVLIPRWAARQHDQAALVVLFGGISFVGTFGLALDPHTAAWTWSACIGAGMPAIVLALQLLQLRAGDTDDTAALSTMVNGVGYAIAGLLSLGIGLLHAATGRWHIALLALLAVLAVQIGTGIAAGHPATVRLNSHTETERGDSRELRR